MADLTQLTAQDPAFSEDVFLQQLTVAYDRSTSGRQLGRLVTAVVLDGGVDGSGQLIRCRLVGLGMAGSEGIVGWSETWLLRRPSGATTAQQHPIDRCALCGAPLHIDATGHCEYCHSEVLDPQWGWNLIDRQRSLGMFAGDGVPAPSANQTHPIGMVDLIRAARATGTWTAGVPAHGFVVTGSSSPEAESLGGRLDVPQDISPQLASIASTDPSFTSAQIAGFGDQCLDSLRYAWVMAQPDASRPFCTAALWESQASAIGEVLRNHGVVTVELLEFTSVNLVHALVALQEQRVTIRYTGRVKAAVQYPGSRTLALASAFASDVTMRRTAAVGGTSDVCFNCGAPLNPGAQACSYCGATSSGQPGRWLAHEVAAVYPGEVMAAFLPSIAAANRAATPYQQR